MEVQSNNAGKAEFFTIAAVEIGHLQEFFSGERSKAESTLLARGIRGERARGRFGARELGMRARERELLLAGCMPDDVHHRFMELIDGAKRFFLPCLFCDPRRTLEDRAEPRDELALAERVRLLEPHAR